MTARHLDLAFNGLPSNPMEAGIPSSRLLPIERSAYSTLKSMDMNAEIVKECRILVQTPEGTGRVTGDAPGVETAAAPEEESDE